MLYLEDLFTTVITLKFYIIVLIGILYILIHHYRYHPVLAYLDILLNYIPVLTHEFGHILFNKISGGRAKDLVIVTRPYERQMTSQQGYAITQSTSKLGHGITTLGGYILPPIMLLVGAASAHSEHPIIFLICYIAIFIYFLILTSRKWSPIIILILLVTLFIFILQQAQYTFTHTIMSYSYHFILGVLLGEVIQSSWTIVKLTFQRPKTQWDGQALADMTHVPSIAFSLIWISINGYSLYLLFQYSFY